MSGSLIRLSKSIVGIEEAEAVAKVILDDGYLGMGKEVQSFEQELRCFLKTEREVVCVNSGTAALHLAVASVVTPGDEVLVQSMTYVASFQAISAAGAVPVACEVHPKTITIDLQDAERRITERTKVIMPVHYAGNPGNLNEIYEFANKHNLRVVEDAAHALGSTYKGELVGTIGDIACFSFDGVKNITSGEGGAIVTSDPQVLQYVQDARLLGVRKDTEKRYEGLRSWEFEVTHQGYRYHMSNLFAAVGKEQLKKFPRFKAERQALAKRYCELLSNINGISTFNFNYNNVVPHIYPVRVHNDQRDGLRTFLIRNNIECGIHYYPNHLLDFYADKLGFRLPVTEKVYDELLTLPLHPDLNSKDQDKVVTLVKDFMIGGISQ